MQELHDQVEELFILERTLQLNDPGILGEGEDVALSSHVCHLVFVDHLILLHFLDGDHIACLSVSADAHFSESATPDDLEWFEITNCDLSSPTCLKKQPLGQNSLLFIWPNFIRYLRHAVQLCLLVLDLLFDELFFLLAQIHLIHLDH